MWEAIRANRRRSLVLVASMFVLLALLGGAVGRLAGPCLGASPQRGQWVGVAVAVGLWAVQFAAALLAGRTILLAVAGARRVTKEDAPQLFNVVEEMSIAASLPRMPDVYVVDSDEPNAFAVGMRPDRAAVAVTTGLLMRMDRDELQGVVAHEVGHVACQDVRFMTMAAIVVGTIVMISDVALRAMFWGGTGRRSSRRGGAAWPTVLVVLVLAVLAPVLARLLYLACSRRREFLADACAARYTRYPEGLARALEKIAVAVSPVLPRAAAPTPFGGRVLAPMCIVNPRRSLVGLFSTHPPTEQRVRVLRAMAGGAGFMDYRDAFRRVLRSDGGFLVGLGPGGRLPAREPSADAGHVDRVERAREARDALDRAAGFVVAPCPCGLRVKVPPGYELGPLSCPRCGREVKVPSATLDTLDAVAAVQPAGPVPVYRRTGRGWESFRCVCGAAVQLSPAFAGSVVGCPRCRRTIRVIPP